MRAIAKTSLTLLAAGLMLSACSSNDTKLHKSLRETFDTEITANGSKMFTFELTTKRPSGPRETPRVKTERNGDKPRSSGLSKKKLKSHLHNRLDQKLVENGYCREGYLVLDSFVARGHASLRGECRETATSGDREKFPNQA
ncbi:hypothetical protein HBA55_10430 [Pseudomaricurvus alkylphenolicus]|jgi:hypothetical protein|uniref:hypothetical protein n=1 Tax=Pseudomaricurvus alkylphenolicus TaxID=1306991 RepID=UPI001423EA5C|nr:hypothetical protein [Pseudomaricurvus alkylphenolicus]NIB40005.1 hypothetical protein [Pseudomaricurvus alkylphenolicus]